MPDAPALAVRGTPRSAAKGRRRPIFFVLVVALIARVMVLTAVVGNYPHNWLYSRGIEMGLLANSLLHGLGYSSPFGGATGPTAFIAPGYPTLVAGIFRLFGTYSFASAIAIVVLQIFVSLLTIGLMMHVAQEMLDGRSAVLAGAFWAVSVPVVWIPTIFWETSISECMLVGMVALALRARRHPSLAMWMGLGAYCALAGLINPALLPAMLAMLGWVAWQARKVVRTAPGVGPLKGLLTGLLTLTLLFSPWPIRNALRFHAFIPLRTTVGFELWMGNRPGATGYLDESLFPMYNQRELASYIAKGELAYTRDKAEAAKEYIREQPGIFLQLSLRRFFRFWTGTGNAVGSVFYAIHATLTSALGAVGILLLFRRKMGAFAWLMLLPLLLFPVPYYITHAEFRYRLVIDPLMTILAAYAVAQGTLAAQTLPDEG